MSQADYLWDIPNHPEDQTPTTSIKATFPQGNFVPAVREQTSPTMGTMEGAANIAALANTPSTHQVQMVTSYADRAIGFRHSTMPIWLAFAGASFALVAVVWILGPLTGQFAFAFGWWVTSEIGVLAVVSLGVWGVMWAKWHHTSPDAIASRTADSRLRMAEEWFNRELDRTYGARNAKHR